MRAFGAAGCAFAGSHIGGAKPKRGNAAGKEIAARRIWPAIPTIWQQAQARKRGAHRWLRSVL